MPACQPLEMPGCYGFHSTRPAPRAASQCGVERRPPLQGRSELQAHDATVLQCLAVEIREGLGRSPSRAIRHPVPSQAPHIVSRRSPCVMPGRRFRPSVSQLSSDLLDHEFPSVERDRATGALALQLWVEMPMISLPSHINLPVDTAITKNRPRGCSEQATLRNRVCTFARTRPFDVNATWSVPPSMTIYVGPRRLAPELPRSASDPRPTSPCRGARAPGSGRWYCRW